MERRLSGITRVNIALEIDTNQYPLANANAEDEYIGVVYRELLRDMEPVIHRAGLPEEALTCLVLRSDTVVADVLWFHFPGVVVSNRELTYSFCDNQWLRGLKPICKRIWPRNTRRLVSRVRTTNLPGKQLRPNQEGNLYPLSAHNVWLHNGRERPCHVCDVGGVFRWIGAS
jgi:hypothetical protein